MASIYFNGRDLASENFINPNLLNNSVGPFPTEGGFKTFDNSTVSLIQGKTYCFSCKTSGIVSSGWADNSVKDNFTFYIYYLNSNKYGAVVGTVLSTNSITWKCDLPTGTYRLGIQKYGGVEKYDVPLSQIKIEEGVTATAWIPSSQDLADLISKK